MDDRQVTVTMNLTQAKLVMRALDLYPGPHGPV
jgi:hypothetical protein